MGWQFGAWGLDKYGPNPKAVDALDFYTSRLQQLWIMITEQQQLALTQFASAAFVTFRTRRAQVSIRLFSALLHPSLLLCVRRCVRAEPCLHLARHQPTCGFTRSPVLALLLSKPLLKVLSLLLAMQCG